MKRCIFALGLVVPVTLLAAPAKPSNASAAPRNPLAFCYLAGLEYSEGAYVGNATCTRTAQDKLDDVRKRPLVWERAGKAERRIAKQK
ncbi:hypothetical protein [Cupriavidus sp. CP313]